MLNLFKIIVINSQNKICLSFHVFNSSSQSFHFIFPPLSTFLLFFPLHRHLNHLHILSVSFHINPEVSFLLVLFSLSLSLPHSPYLFLTLSPFLSLLLSPSFHFSISLFLLLSPAKFLSLIPFLSYPLSLHLSIHLPLSPFPSLFHSLSPLHVSSLSLSLIPSLSIALSLSLSRHLLFLL